MFYLIVKSHDSATVANISPLPTTVAPQRCKCDLCQFE